MNHEGSNARAITRLRGEVASGCDGAEHFAVRLLHTHAVGAEAPSVAREDLHGRGRLVLQRCRDADWQRRGGILAEDLDLALVRLTAAETHLEDAVGRDVLVRVLVSRV